METTRIQAAENRGRARPAERGRPDRESGHAGRRGSGVTDEQGERAEDDSPREPKRRLDVFA